MDDLRQAIREAMEGAAISGLCHDGQVEIACQVVARLRPGLAAEERLALVEAENGN